MADITIHGKRACSCMVDTLEMVEERLRAIGAIKKDLSGLITQGSYSTGVAASAGTHGGGGSIDVKWYLADTDEKLRAWRESGIYMSERLTSEGKWPRHGHGIWIGCPHLSASAKRQQNSFKAGKNGLVSNKDSRGPHIFVKWQDALNKWKASKVQAAEPKPVPAATAIPRYYTAKPWMWIPESGRLDGTTISRLQWQLNIKPTGYLDHYTVRALKVWLNRPDTINPVQLTPDDVKALQYRIGFRGKWIDGNWGPLTTRKLQEFLNKHR